MLLIYRNSLNIIKETRDYPQPISLQRYLSQCFPVFCNTFLYTLKTLENERFIRGLLKGFITFFELLQSDLKKK